MSLILWFRYIFFSDWDTLNGEPGLERAYMDGTNRYGIIRSKLGWPAGITLDIDAKRVYWVDSRYDYVETTTYDGLHRYAKKLSCVILLTCSCWHEWHSLNMLL